MAVGAAVGATVGDGGTRVVGTGVGGRGVGCVVGSKVNVGGTDATGGATMAVKVGLGKVGALATFVVAMGEVATEDCEKAQ